MELNPSIWISKGKEKLVTLHEYDKLHTENKVF